ncbi:MAG: RNA polymerase sigma factor, partial [Actinobacteria bacterium]
MEVSAFRGSTPANISAPSLDGKGGDEPDGREHERALVRRAQDGDRDAFGDLYRTHLPAISRLVRFRLGTEDEDAVSEVFLRAWRGLGSYRDTGVPFAAWLYGIARHVAIDLLRKRGRDEPRDELPERGVEPVTAEVLTLRGAIDHLPTEQR